MLWKKAFLLGLGGFVCGALIGVAFGLFGSPDSGGLTLPNVLMGGFYGAVAMGSSVIYEIEKWSVARATATHFLLAFGLYILLVLSLGWFRIDDPVFWIVIAAMVAVYVLIWGIQYLAYSRKVRTMNKKLEKIRSRNRTE